MPVDRPTMAAVHEFYSRPDARSAVKTPAAAFLLRHTREEGFYSFLKKEALRGERDAIRRLCEVSIEGSIRREETASLVRTLLSRIPMTAQAPDSGMDRLVRYLGELGDATDTDRLAAYCKHDDGSLVSEAIHALAKVNEKVALEQAKERLRLYATKAIPKEDFWWWYVMPYLDLFLCFEDRSAIADMNEVLKRLGTERDREEEIKLIEILLRFLKAEGAEDRAKLAVEFIRNDRVDPFFRKKLADRLIEEGAPPERLKELMADPIR